MITRHRKRHAASLIERISLVLASYAATRSRAFNVHSEALTILLQERPINQIQYKTQNDRDAIQQTTCAYLFHAGRLATLAAQFVRE